MAFRLLRAFLLCLPLLSQPTDFAARLANIHAHKVILFGQWGGGDVGKWKQVIESEGIFEHGIVLVNNIGFIQGYESSGFYVRWSESDVIRDSWPFQQWFIQTYSTSPIARWAALNIENKLITSGVEVPNAKDFEQALDRYGLKSPLRQIRAFRTENPDHIDAKTHLLEEVRRRALHMMPHETSEDLDMETDLRTWGVMAAETDRVLSGLWIGIDLICFRPGLEQPERFSPLMKTVFRKHILAVEVALRGQPTDRTLWNIWAWMVRSLGDHKWELFIDSLEPVDLGIETDVGAIFKCPSAEVCHWLVEAYKEKGDWNRVLKYAEIAGNFWGYTLLGDYEWRPDGALAGYNRFDRMEGFPITSSYLPRLEALLRLGRVEEAEGVFDSMMWISSNLHGDKRGEYAPLAAEAARSVGMEALAEVWSKGQIVNDVPRLQAYRDSIPTFVLYSDYPLADSLRWQYRDKFYTLFASMGLHGIEANYVGNLEETFVWARGGGNRWGLLDGERRLLEQGEDVPEPEALRAILRHHHIISPQEMLRVYVSEHGDLPVLNYLFALRLIIQNAHILANADKGNVPVGGALPLADNVDSEAFGIAGRVLRRVLTDYPEPLVNIPLVNMPRVDDIGIYSILKRSTILKALSGPCLSKIESFLRIKPSSNGLWQQWFFWKAVEENGRMLSPLLNQIKLSPMTQPGTVPSGNLMLPYYRECREDGNWPEVTLLLKTVWDRELFKFRQDMEENPGQMSFRSKIAEPVGLLLMEAYLQNDSPYEANEVFGNWLSSGGKFTKLDTVLELAREKGQDGLARQWEARAGIGVGIRDQNQEN